MGGVKIDWRNEDTRRFLPDMRGWRAPRIVAWFNEHAIGYVATCEQWTVSTDRHPKGVRWRTPGKGRRGYRVLIFKGRKVPYLAGRREAVHCHDTAETYRTTDDLMNWIAANVPLKSPTAGGAAPSSRPVP